MLASTNPDANALLESGEFAVQRSTNAFAQVPVDQSIEQTVNKDTKIMGGIVGKSLKPRTVKRWMTTAHDRAQTTAVCGTLAGVSVSSAPEQHRECSKSRLRHDAEDVQRLINTMQSVAASLVASSNELINVATASPKVREDLEQARHVGEQAMEEFIKERLLPGTVSFHAPLTKLKLSTFASLVKSTAHGRNVPVHADRQLFARMLVISQSREKDLQHVLSFSLGSLPWSLASPPGKFD